MLIVLLEYIFAQYWLGDCFIRVYANLYSILFYSGPTVTSTIDFALHLILKSFRKGLCITLYPSKGGVLDII